MDRNEIHRRALRVAAKVSLSLLGLGCGASEALSALDERAGEGAAGCAAVVGACQGVSAGAGGSPTGGQAGQTSVAVSGGAPGAGGSVTGGAGQGGSAAGGASMGASGAGVAGAAGQGGVAGQSLAAVVCGGATEPPASEAQVSCCLDVVNKVFLPGEPLPVTLSDEALACCQVLTDAFNDPPPGVTPPSFQVYTDCCPYLDPMGTACFGWGPPMPPAMIVALLDEERNA